MAAWIFARKKRTAPAGRPLWATDRSSTLRFKAVCYTSRRRRSSPAAPIRPDPKSTSDEGSGTEDGVIVPPGAATFPVNPVLPIMSEAKKKPPALPTNSETLTPFASVTVNDSGPGWGAELPFPQPEQVTE